MHKGLALPVGTSVGCPFQGATGDQAPGVDEGTAEGALSSGDLDHAPLQSSTHEQPVITLPHAKIHSITSQKDTWTWTYLNTTTEMT